MVECLFSYVEFARPSLALVVLFRRGVELVGIVVAEAADVLDVLALGIGVVLGEYALDDHLLELAALGRRAQRVRFAELTHCARARCHAAAAAAAEAVRVHRHFADAQSAMN